MFDFYVGERKFIEVIVQPEKPGEIVVITSAKFELLDGEKIVESGKCEVDKDRLEFLLSTDTAGYYMLKTTCQIGQETIIDKTTVAVRC